MQQNKSLKAFNTFGVESQAQWFVEAHTADEIWSCLNEFRNQPITVLGGGSNLLLTRDIPGVVLKISLKGMSVVAQAENHVILEVQAGEVWQDVVTYCLNNNFGGIENLALIPGQMGTAPIQNIGAYGIELKDVFDSCVAMNRDTGAREVFHLEDCKFGYRESVFKNELKNQYIILSVRMRLTTKEHELKLDYGSIKEVLEQKGIEKPGIREVAQAVIDIRRSKLPDPKDLGNSGSFFKNPVVTLEQAERLKNKFPDMPTYSAGPGMIKIPAGWLIEQAGFKGIRQGDAGVHKNQALVLVNYGSASGSEIWHLAQQIQQKIRTDYGIELTAEVNII